MRKICLIVCLFFSLALWGKEGDTCYDPMLVQYGDDHTLSGQPVWFLASMESFGNGMNAYWYSTDSLRLEAYLTCISLRPAYERTIGPQGIFSLSLDELLHKVDSVAASLGLGQIDDILQLFPTVNIKVVPVGEQAGRLIFQEYPLGPKTDCDNPLPVYMDAPYLLTDTANVYALTFAEQPDSMHVVWTSEPLHPDSLPVIQVRRGACDGEILAEEQPDTNGVYVLPQEWMDEVYRSSDTLFFHIFVKKNGKIRFRPVTYTYAEVDTVLCEGKGLQLQDTLLKASTSYTDTVIKSDGYRHFITHYELEVQPAPETNDTLYVGAAELPLQMQEVWIESEGNYSLRYQTEEGCDSIVHLQVYIQTSLRETSESSLKVYPTLAKTGTPVQIEWPEGYEKASLDLFDLSGRLLWSRDDQPTFIQLDKAGVYLLVMTSKNGKGQTLLMAHD